MARMRCSFTRNASSACVRLTRNQAAIHKPIEPSIRLNIANDEGASGGESKKSTAIRIVEMPAVAKGAHRQVNREDSPTGARYNSHTAASSETARSRIKHVSSSSSSSSSSST
jgi:hypothetical protein